MHIVCISTLKATKMYYLSKLINTEKKRMEIDYFLNIVVFTEDV